MDLGLMIDLLDKEVDPSYVDLKMREYRIKSLLENSNGVIDKYYLMEINRRIDLIDDELNNYKKEDYDKYVTLLGKIQEKTKELTEYFNVIEKIKYINSHIRKCSNSKSVLRWVDYLTWVLMNIKNIKMFYLDRQRDNYNLLYKTTYEFIKGEFLENGSSLLLNVIKDQEDITSIISEYVLEDLKNIDASTFANLKQVELLKKELNSVLLSKESIVRESVIRAILRVTNTEEYAKLLSKLTTNMYNDIKNNEKSISLKIKEELKEKNKELEECIRILNSNIEELKRCFGSIFISLVFLIGYSAGYLYVDKNKAKYETKITSYSTISDSLSHYKKNLEKIKKPISYSLKVGEKSKTYDIFRTLEVSSEPYYNSLGEKMVDYEIYDISDNKFTEACSNYTNSDLVITEEETETNTKYTDEWWTFRNFTKLDINKISDLKIEEGSKYTYYSSDYKEVVQKVQDPSKKTFSDFADAFRYSIATLGGVMGFSGVMEVINMYKILSEKKKYVLYNNKLVKKIEELTNEFNNLLLINEKDIEKYKVIINELEKIVGSTDINKKHKLNNRLNEVQEKHQELKRKLTM